MKNKKEAILITVGVVFLAAVIVYTMGIFENLGQQVAQEFYVNAKGQKWTLPEGKYEFTVSASGYPRFIGGVIDPVKVKVGDTQTMTVRVASPVPIESVVASIETDTKTQEIPLALKESKTLSAEYFENQPYLINQNDELIINKAGSNYAKRVLEQIVASAEAQSLVEYVFEGTWIVNDTHVKTYHTVFTATDEDGNTDDLKLMWSDPECNFILDVDGSTGLLQVSCTVTNGVEGFDGGDLALNENTVTLSGTSSLIWNGDAESNRSLIIGAGSIIIGNGTQIKEALLWYNDSDGDGFTDDLATIHYSCQEECNPRVRVKDSPSRPWYGTILTNGNLDCIDSALQTPEAADVHPQLPGFERYFKNAITNPLSPSQAYDYNCSGGATGGWDNNAPPVSSTTVVYQTVSGGEEGVGEYICVVGLTLASSTFADSGYCEQTSGYSIISCDAGSITQIPQGNPEVIPLGLDNGFTTYVDDSSPCSPCIGASLAGFCH